MGNYGLCWRCASLSTHNRYIYITTVNIVMCEKLVEILKYLIPTNLFLYNISYIILGNVEHTHKLQYPIGTYL